MSEKIESEIEVNPAAPCSPSFETEAMRHFLALHGWKADDHEPVKTIISVLSRVERERNEARAEIEQLKSKLTQPHGCVTISRNGYVQEIEQQRDTLVEAMRIIDQRAMSRKDAESDLKFCGEVAFAAIAAVKGGSDE